MVILKRTILTSNFYRKLFPVSMANISGTKPVVSLEDDVLFESVKDKGIITLNRPKALNALNLSMVHKLHAKLKQWEAEKSLVIIKGAGEKAFCAGGDIRAVTEAGKRGERTGHDFFRTEYLVNGIIGTYGKPYIALIDGIVMGGGVGLSVHGHYRVATERTLFAMPEMAIGLFPDVGGSYFLPRLGGKLGYYLALTGYRLKGAEVMKAGIATHYIESHQLKDLESALVDCCDEQAVKEVLKELCKKDNSAFSLAPYMNQINKCFSASTVEGILSNLKEDPSMWAKSTAATLRDGSPTSLKIALRALQVGATLNLQECLQMEYRLAVACLANKDFYEGVRALLIDKDKKPVWNPKTLEEVSDQYLESYFKKLPETEELRHKL